MSKEQTPEIRALKEEQLRAQVEKAAADARKAVAEANAAELDGTLKAEKLSVETDKLRVDLTLAQEKLVEARISNQLSEMRLASAKLDDDNLHTNDFFHKRYVFDQQVSSKSVDDCISRLTTWSRAPRPDDEPLEIEIVFNSPGGEIISGMALLDYILMLRGQGIKVKTTALGMAASMAAILLQAGEVRAMGPNAVLLIHQASYGISGSHGDVQDRVKMIEILHERIIDLFVDRCAMDRADFKTNWERRDWWMSAQDALDKGFIDEIVQVPVIAPRV